MTSAAELKEAVTQGLPHIEIRQHLDLRDGAPAIPASPGQALPGRRLQDVKQKPPILGTVKATLRAIRVRTLGLKLELLPLQELLRCVGPCHLHCELHCMANACMCLFRGCHFSCSLPRMHSYTATVGARIGMALNSAVPRRSQSFRENAGLFASCSESAYQCLRPLCRALCEQQVERCVHTVYEHVHVDRVVPDAVVRCAC